MTMRLTQRLTRLEGISLAPWMQGMATSIAHEQGLDPREVLQETRAILRQFDDAGIPLTEAAVTAFLDPAGPGGTTR